MEIATAMSHLVLDMRSNGRNTPVNKQKLERLAVQFLRASEQGKGTTKEFEQLDKEQSYTM
jgi:hypothetical protein